MCGASIGQPFEIWPTVHGPSPGNWLSSNTIAHSRAQRTGKLRPKFHQSFTLDLKKKNIKMGLFIFPMLTLNLDLTS